MNKNIENYKKTVDQIHADSNLKNKVLEEMKEKQNKNATIYYLRYAVGIAAIAVVAIVGVSFLKKSKDDVLNVKPNLSVTEEEKSEALAKVDIRRFESMEELREVLKENESSYSRRYYYEDAIMNVAEEAKSSETQSATYGDSNLKGVDYSKTNNQVENVDEADIVKTDGKYIYYSQNNRVYIVDTDLNLISTLKEDNFRSNQIFVNGTKLVIFGTKYDNSDIVAYKSNNLIEDVEEENVSTVYRTKTYIRVYDLSDIENPKMTREIKVDGNYQDARMIKDNIYLVTNYYTYFYNKLDDLKDIDILPSYEDSLIKGTNYIEATDIAYFEETNDTSYSIIVGFNLNSNQELSIETFFGAGSEMYVSENNLYLITPKGYYWDAKESTIYKFKLENSKVLAVASGNVEGYVGDQFAIDEYNGNLRVATTSLENNYRNFWYNGDYESHYSTHLTIFNENLEKIGAIEDLIKDEEIYSVRFIGKVGYIVTFQEIDPLWVIDLSDPTNPVVKGELEIPGYSSYLHPYDETHIIGIGYNVKDNGYGGVTNDTIKISMFDVSDVKNPKEMFNKTIDHKYANSEIMYDHKALFFNKSENLIGFPISWYSRRENKSGLVLFRIDLENNKFEEIDDLIESTTYFSMERAIYIGNSIYTIHMDQIIQYNMKTFDKIRVLELEYDNDYGYYYW